MDHDDAPVGNLLSRRDALRVLGGVGLLPLMGRRTLIRPSDDSPTRSRDVVSGLAPRGQMCVVRPEQTEGPYFVDLLLDRSDIRTNPPASDLVPGLPLELALNVSRIRGNECAPFEGAVVDVWQCDCVGVYSSVEDPRFSTLGQRWLRGYQITDAQGQARFTTIYPGWYEGRTVHIHFKIRTSIEDESQEFISQVYFDDAFTDQVFMQVPYSARDGERTRNEDDRIFNTSGGSQLILDVEEAADGYRTSFDIGVQI